MEHHSINLCAVNPRDTGSRGPYKQEGRENYNMQTTILRLEADPQNPDAGGVLITPGFLPDNLPLDVSPDSPMGQGLQLEERVAIDRQGVSAFLALSVISHLHERIAAHADAAEVASEIREVREAFGGGFASGAGLDA